MAWRTKSLRTLTLTLTLTLITFLHQRCPLESATRNGRLMSIRLHPFRFTTEFDSEGPLFLHKVSFKFFNSLAKLKFSFQNNTKGEIFCSHAVGFYNKESEQLGAVTMKANLPNPSVKLELSSSVPSNGLQRAALEFPYGEIALEQRENVEETKEVKKVLSVDGILKTPLLNGVSTVVYNGKDLNLRYIYKDTRLSFIPCVNLPTNKVSFAFKLRFSPSDKLSYWYHFDWSAWSVVYKHTVGKDLKVKVGYDSEVRLDWVSLWVGSEDGKAKEAPMKLKAQMMLQVPEDDIKAL